MRQKSQNVEESIASPRIVSELVTDAASLRTIEEGDPDSGTETLHDTDSEPEDQQSKQEELIEACTGLNVSKVESSHKNRIEFSAFRFENRKRMKLILIFFFSN